jgi:hypothetical protein
VEVPEKGSKQTSLRRWFQRWAAAERRAELGFVQHKNAEFAGLVELGAGAFAGQDIVGVLAHETGDVAARLADECGGLVVGQRRQRASQANHLMNGSVPAIVECQDGGTRSTC